MVLTGKQFLFAIFIILSNYSFTQNEVNIESKVKNYSKLIIKELHITKIPATKENGNSWDNAFGEYLPDIYLKIVDKDGNYLYGIKEDYRLENIKNSNLPRGWIFSKPYVIYQKDFNRNIWFCLIDYDSITEDDLVGCIPFNIQDYNGDENEIILKRNDTEIKIKVEWVPFEKYCGVYHTDFSTLTINHISNKKYKFSIEGGTAKGCFVGIEGNIIIIGNKAVFSDEGCESLKFTFYNTKVFVDEESCDDFHGVGCSFYGTYFK